MSGFDVIGIGGAAYDTLSVVQSYPRYRSKVESLRLVRQPGGQVPTALSALARWGQKVAFAGRLGVEPESQASLEALREEGVDLSRVRIDPEARAQVSVILVDAARGERTIVWSRAGGTPFRPGHLAAGFVEDGRILLLDGYDPVAPAAARRARRAGARVVLDAERPERWTAALLRHTDVLIACEEFPAAMVGGRSAGGRLAALQALGPKTVVVTRGHRGAMALGPTGELLRSPALKVKVKDTTGAGDIFHAGFVHGMLEDWPLDRCLAFANLTAGLKCRKLGGRPGIPSLEEALKRLSSQPVRPGR